MPNLLTLHILNNHCHISPLYPGTLFPACPGGGVLELPNPMHDAVIGDPVSRKRNIIYRLMFQFEMMISLVCLLPRASKSVTEFNCRNR